MKKSIALFAIMFSLFFVACTNSSFNEGDVVYAKGGAGAFSAQAYDEMVNYVASGNEEGFKRLLFTDKALILGFNDKYTVIQPTSRYTIVRDHAGRELYVRNDLLSKTPFQKE